MPTGLLGGVCELLAVLVSLDVLAVEAGGVIVGAGGAEAVVSEVDVDEVLVSVDGVEAADDVELLADGVLGVDGVLTTLDESIFMFALDAAGRGALVCVVVVFSVTVFEGFAAALGSGAGTGSGAGEALTVSLVVMVLSTAGPEGTGALTSAWATMSFEGEAATVLVADAAGFSYCGAGVFLRCWSTSTAPPSTLTVITPIAIPKWFM